MSNYPSDPIPGLTEMRDAIIQLADILYRHKTGADTATSPVIQARELAAIRDNMRALYPETPAP